MAAAFVIKALDLVSQPLPVSVYSSYSLVLPAAFAFAQRALAAAAILALPAALIFLRAFFSLTGFPCCLAHLAL